MYVYIIRNKQEKRNNKIDKRKMFDYNIYKSKFKSCVLKLW